jgi:amino acid permease
VIVFTFQFNLLPTANELGEKKAKRILSSVIWWSLGLIATIYIVEGLCGIALFKNVESDVLKSMSSLKQGHVVMSVVSAAYGLSVLGTFPMQFFSLRNNTHALLSPLWTTGNQLSDETPLLPSAALKPSGPHGETELDYESSTLVFFIETVVLLAAIWGLAVAVPDIGTLFEVVGATSATCIAYIFPAACDLRALRLAGVPWKSRRVWLAVTLLIVGVLVCLTCTTVLILLKLHVVKVVK